MPAEVPADVVAGFKAIARLYNASMTGFVPGLVTQPDAEAGSKFMFAHFCRQHLEGFLPGLEKLGLETLPHAVRGGHADRNRCLGSSDL